MTIRQSFERKPFAMPDYLQSDILLNLKQQAPREDSSPYRGLYAAMQKDIRQVETLTSNVRGLLRDCDDVLDSEGIRYQVETLERCMDAYRRGMVAAKIVTEFGDSWLQDVQSRLRQAIDERHRFDGEGGSYMPPKGGHRLEKPADRLAEVAARMEETLNAINGYFPKPYSMQNDESASASRH